MRPSIDEFSNGLLDAKLRTAEVAEAAGATLRQLQWWDERRVVSPSHAGGRREYSFQEALEISVASAFRAKGVPLSRIRRILATLRNGAGIVEAPSNDKEILLLSSVGGDWLIDGNEKAVRKLIQTEGPVLAVSVSDCLSRLRRSVRPRKPMATSKGDIVVQRPALAS